VAGFDPDFEEAVELSVASERALQLECPGSTVLFGIGPPTDSNPRRRRAAALLAALNPALSSLRWCDQVHGTDILTVTEKVTLGASCIGIGDGLMTSEPELGLMVWTADCVPILLTGSRAVAAVHAGWRGAAGGIVRVAVERCVSEDHGSPAELCAHLGPAVSGDAYQVGPEVVDALRSQGVSDDSWLAGDRVDLRRFVGLQLFELGIARIVMVGGCTASTPQLASFRRDGSAAGRQWSCVYRSR
jgi:YfiH family protein